MLNSVLPLMLAVGLTVTNPFSVTTEGESVVDLTTAENQYGFLPVLQIVYDANGGNADTVFGQKINSLDTAVLASDIYSAQGYVLKGWNTEPDGTGKSFVSGDTFRCPFMTRPGEMTLYAQWEPLFYSVDFASEDPDLIYGTDTLGEMSAQRVSKVDSKYVAPQCEYSIDDYHFVEWNTQSDGSGEGFQPGDEINVGEYDDKELTLYARWESDYKYPAIDLLGKQAIMDKGYEKFIQQNYTQMASGKSFSAKLGNSGFSIYQSGCLVCAVAFNYRYQPGLLSNEMQEGRPLANYDGALDRYSDFWEAVNTDPNADPISDLALFIAGDECRTFLFGSDLYNGETSNILDQYSKHESGENKIAKIYEFLQEGRMAILNIKYEGSHYVVVYGCNASDELSPDNLLIFDPGNTPNLNTLTGVLGGRKPDGTAAGRPGFRSVTDPTSAVWAVKIHQ